MAEAPVRTVVSGPQPSSVLQVGPSGTSVARFTLAGDVERSPVSVTVADDAGIEQPAAWHVSDDEVAIELPRGGPYTVGLEVGADVFTVPDLLVGDVWLLGGQSNMQGAEPSEPDSDAVALARLFSVDRTWKEGREPLHRIWEDRRSVQLRIHPVMYPDSEESIETEYHRRQGTPAQGEGGVGPGLGFADELIRLTGTPVGLVPCALGSTSLELWTKAWGDANAGRDDPSGSLFWNLIWRGQETGAAAGLVWYQGEADSAPVASDTYAERFLAFLADVRSELNLPDLPALVVQIGSVDASDPLWQAMVQPETVSCWERVREQIRLLPTLDPRIRIAIAADLPKWDFGHVSAAGQRELGRRLAHAAIALRDGGATPDLAGVEPVDGDTCALRVLLTGVSGGFQPAETIAGAFELRSEGKGVQRPDACTVTGDVVLLHFAEPVRSGDQLVHGPGLTPQFAGTDGRGLPLPCFGPVRVST